MQAYFMRLFALLGAALCCTGTGAVQTFRYVSSGDSPEPPPKHMTDSGCSDTLTQPGANGASTEFYTNLTSWRSNALTATHYNASDASGYTAESWTSAATGVLYVDGTDAAFVSDDGNFNLTAYLSSFAARSSISALVLNPWGSFLGLDERNQFELLQAQYGNNLQSQANALANSGVQLLLAVALGDNSTAPLSELLLEEQAISTQIQLGMNGTWAGDDVPGWLPQSWTGDEFESPQQRVRFDPNMPLVLSVAAPQMEAAPLAPLAWTPFSRLLPAGLVGDTWPASAWRALELRHSPVVDAFVQNNRTAAVLQAFVGGGAPAVAQMIAGWASAITPRESELMRRTGLMRGFLHPLVAPAPSPSLPPFASPTPHSTPSSSATAPASPSKGATTSPTATTSPRATASGTAVATVTATSSGTARVTASGTAAATASGTQAATPCSTPYPTDTPTQSATPPRRLRRLGRGRRAAVHSAHTQRKGGAAGTAPQASGLSFRQLSSVPYFPVPATNSNGELQAGAVTASLHVARCTSALVAGVPPAKAGHGGRSSATNEVCAVWLLGNAAAVRVNATVDVTVLQQYVGDTPAGAGTWDAFDMYHGTGLYAPTGVVNVPMGPLDASAVLAIPAAAPRSGELDAFLALMRVATQTPLGHFSAQWAPVAQTFTPPVPARPALAPPRGMLFVPGGVAFPYTVRAALPPVLSSAFPAAAAAWGGQAPPGYGVQFSWESAPTAVHAPYSIWPRPLFADIVPATNGQWRRFLLETGFAPVDDRGYLAHWRWDGCTDRNVSNCMPQRMKRQPVVFVAPSDAAAYCAWRGGRLPTDWEWAFLASASPVGAAAPTAWDIRQYPWGDTPCNSSTCPPPLTTARDLPPGTHAYDKLPDVGSFPAGASPWGLLDMAALVRQWTGGVYCDVRGGVGGTVGRSCRVLSRGGSAWQPRCVSSTCYYPSPTGTSNAQHMVHSFAAEFQLRNGFTGLRCIADTPARATGEL